MTPGKPDIHQRVAERIDAESYSLEHSEVGLVAAVLEEEYGPIIKAAIEIVEIARFVKVDTVMQQAVDATRSVTLDIALLQAELSQKGLL